MEHSGVLLIFEIDLRYELNENTFFVPSRKCDVYNDRIERNLFRSIVVYSRRIIVWKGASNELRKELSIEFVERAIRFLELTLETFILCFTVAS